MKVTNVSTSVIYLDDLHRTRESQAEGRPGEEVYLHPGQSVYLLNTSEVLRSARFGDIFRWQQLGIVDVEDSVTLAANGNPGDSVTLTHNWNFAPGVSVLRWNGATWSDASGTYDAVHNTVFTTVTVTNTTAGALDFLIRLL